MFKHYILFLFSFLIVGATFAQTSTDRQLAEHYYNNKELDKALPYYEKLLKSEPSKFNVQRLFDCYVATGDSKEAEKLMKKQINQNRSDLDYPVILAQFYEDQGDVEKANGLYEDLPEKDYKENEIFRTESQNIGLNIVGKIDLSKIPKK